MMENILETVNSVSIVANCQFDKVSSASALVFTLVSENFCRQYCLPDDSSHLV